jgi:hypothetical protein
MHQHNDQQHGNMQEYCTINKNKLAATEAADKIKDNKAKWKRAKSTPTKKTSLQKATNKAI